MVTKKRLLAGATLLLLAAVTWIVTEPQTTRDNEQQPKSTGTVGRDRSLQHRSRVASAVQAMRKAHDPAQTISPSRLAQRHFATGRILHSRLENLPDGVFRRTEIIETSLKYPFIRLEADFRLNGTNEVLLRMSEVVADHVVVSLRDGVTEEQLAGRAAAVGGIIVRRLAVDGPATYIVGLPAPQLDAVPEAISAFAGMSDIVLEADGDSVSRKAAVPNDSYYSSQWHVNNRGDADIDASEAWSLHTGSPAVIVAVSDTGVDFNHLDLQPNLWTNLQERVNSFDDDGNSYNDDTRGWNFYNKNNNVFDTDGHGTAVSGIIGAAANNARGVAGIAWKCRVLPVRALDTSGGVASDIAEGFDYARKHGAHIINASHGGGDSAVMKAAVDRLQAAGVLLIAAAGNREQNIDALPLYPASYPNPNVISVAASDYGDDLAYYSSYGATSVDLAAPGLDIISTAIGNRYESNTGTSFSVPQVAGVAALVKAKYPTLSATEIRARILGNVDKRPGLAGKCATGGRLNAYRALLAKITLATALDREALPWSTGSAAPWVAGVTPFAHDKVDAVESAKISDNQQSVLQATVNGPGSGSFWWRVSCEHDYDYISFSIDGSEVARLTGVRAWSQETFTVGSGTHTLTWRYVKDGSASSGDDKAMVDQFVYKGFPPTITSQPVSQAAPLGGSASFSVGVSGPGPFRYQWRRNGVNIAGATRSTLTYNNIKAAHAGTYTVAVQNGGGTRVSNGAKLTICTSTIGAKEVILGYEAATSSFPLTIAGTCSWDVQTTNSWIQLDPTSVSASTTYQFSVLANESKHPRVGAITIGTNLFRVRQLGFPAPSWLGQNQRFTLTITNSADQSITNGSLLLVTRQESEANRFTLQSTQSAISPDDGTYVYQPQNATNAALYLTGSQSISVGLAFESATRGIFVFQHDSAPEIYGTFQTASGFTDFNDDGYTDLLWQTTNRQLTGWCMRGTALVESRKFNGGAPLPAGWNAVTVGEFLSGEVQTIVQWTNRQLATLSLSTNSDSFNLSPLSETAVVPSGAKVISTGDFNQDGQPDLLLQGSNSRALVMVLDGTNLVETIALRNNASAGTGWRLVGAADFNNDASPDLLWQHTDGRLQVWHLVGTTYLSGKTLQRPTTGWKAIGLGDFNNDSRVDILFQATDRKLALWLMNGTTVVQTRSVKNGQPAPLGWKLIGPK